MDAPYPVTSGIRRDVPMWPLRPIRSVQVGEAVIALETALRSLDKPVAAIPTPAPVPPAKAPAKGRKKR